jgi:uncharacterized protein (UPF0212 family)
MALMSCTTTFIVAALYIVAGILGLTGILLTVSVFQRDNENGTATVETRLVIGRRLPDNKPLGWWGVAGPGLIASSVIVGMFGNLVWLLSS